MFAKNPAVNAPLAELRILGRALTLGMMPSNVRFGTWPCRGQPVNVPIAASERRADHAMVPYGGDLRVCGRRYHLRCSKPAHRYHVLPRFQRPLALLAVGMYLLGAVTGGSLLALLRQSIEERNGARRARRSAAY